MVGSDEEPYFSRGACLQRDLKCWCGRKEEGGRADWSPRVVFIRCLRNANDQANIPDWAASRTLPDVVLVPGRVHYQEKCNVAIYNIYLLKIWYICKEQWFKIDSYISLAWHILHIYEYLWHSILYVVRSWLSTFSASLLAWRLQNGKAWTGVTLRYLHLLVAKLLRIYRKIVSYFKCTQDYVFKQYRSKVVVVMGHNMTIIVTYIMQIFLMFYIFFGIC